MIGRLPQRPAMARLDCGHIPAVTEPESLAKVVTSV